MLNAIMLGSGFALAAAIQPGPLQAFLLARVLAVGSRRTLPAAFSPLVSDAPIGLLVLLVLRTLPPPFERGLRVGGGLFLLYLAWGALAQARSAAALRDADSPPPRTLLQAAVVNLLNPNPYLGWALVLGPWVIAAWRVAPAHAIALLCAFFVTMVVSLGAFILLCGRARALPARTQRALMVVSALVLAGLGGWQLAVGLGAGGRWPR